MFSLLAAIGIALYLLLRVGFENNSIAANKTKWDDERKEFDDFCEKYAAPSEEVYEVRKKLYSPELAELRKEIEEVTGVFPPTPSEVLWGYYAKQGKVVDRNSITGNTYGDNLFSRNPWHSISPWKDKYSYETMKAAKIKFLKWLDRELRTNGMEYPLMYCASVRGGMENGHNVFRLSKAKGIQEYTEPDASVMFFWYPTRHYQDNMFCHHIYDN